ncbi:MAG: hypothetical protein AAGI91_12295 [Bacteroidota bacterium]
MLLRLLPLAFVALAVVQFVLGRPLVGGSYGAIALGLGLYGSGARQGVRPLQWFGAGIAAFALVILLWAAFGR